MRRRSLPGYAPPETAFYPNTWAAARTSPSSITCIGLAAFQSTATCETLRTTSLSSSKRFPSISTEIEVNPVMLPPGRARLATRPVATGSPTATMTRGTVLVAFLTASEAGVPAVTIHGDGLLHHLIFLVAGQVAGDLVIVAMALNHMTVVEDGLHRLGEAL